MDILEELFYGNIAPCQRSFHNREQCSQLMGYLSRQEQTLMESLSEEQRKVFKKYRDNTLELEKLTELDAFLYGFRLGGRFQLEMLREEKKN